MRVCMVEGCERKYLAKGYCVKHYQKYVKYGDPLHVERINIKHGMSHTPEYKIWQCMKDRCYNKNYRNYHRYGGRGITVCDRWHNSFMAFYADMGKRPFPKAQIDRKDNEEKYTPENCRWVTNAENCRNRPSTKLTIEKVKEIRFLYKIGAFLQKELGLIYNVDTGSINLIINNKAWQEDKG